jgi:hypothetical protein
MRKPIVDERTFARASLTEQSIECQVRAAGVRGQLAVVADAKCAWQRSGFGKRSEVGVELVSSCGSTETLVRLVIQASSLGKRCPPNSCKCRPALVISLISPGRCFSPATRPGFKTLLNEFGAASFHVIVFVVRQRFEKGAHRLRILCSPSAEAAARRHCPVRISRKTCS